MGLEPFGYVTLYRILPMLLLAPWLLLLGLRGRKWFNDDSAQEVLWFIALATTFVLAVGTAVSLRIADGTAPRVDPDAAVAAAHKEVQPEPSSPGAPTLHRWDLDLDGDADYIAVQQPGELSLVAVSDPASDPRPGVATAAIGGVGLIAAAYAAGRRRSD